MQQGKKTRRKELCNAWENNLSLGHASKHFTAPQREKQNLKELAKA